MKNKIYLIYDERARVMDLDNCTVLTIANTEKEAIEEANSNKGVIVEAIHDKNNNIISQIIIN